MRRIGVAVAIPGRRLLLRGSVGPGMVRRRMEDALQPVERCGLGLRCALAGNFRPRRRQRNRAALCQHKRFRTLARQRHQAGDRLARQLRFNCGRLRCGPVRRRRLLRSNLHAAGSIVRRRIGRCSGSGRVGRAGCSRCSPCRRRNGRGCIIRCGSRLSHWGRRRRRIRRGHIWKCWIRRHGICWSCVRRCVSGCCGI
jgi:hypothetical protein